MCEPENVWTDNIQASKQKYTNKQNKTKNIWQPRDFNLT